MSLKEALKQRILVDMIKKTRQNDEFVVFVVDSHTSKIVSSCCRMYDIMDSGVIVLESINVKREKLDMPAIYFLEPTDESISRLIEDFKDVKKPQYSVVHLFFSSRLDQSLMEMLATGNVVNRIKTLTELYCDFVALESRVYLFERRKAIARLYPEDAKQTDKFDTEISKTTMQLVSLLLTMHEYPYIRFQGSSGLCQLLAQRVEGELNRIISKLNDWKTDERERGTLFIIDRSLDPTAPLMHEYTYQSMLSDLLDVNGEICTIKTSAPAPEDAKAKSAPNTKPGEEQHVLSEEDPLWVEFRHQHIGIVMNAVTQRFHEFRNKNAAAIFQSANKGEVSLKDMNAAINALPQYQYMIRQYRKHMAIAESCMEQYDQQNLQEISELEQDMATGLDADGSKVNMKTVMDKLSKMCQEPKISKFIKLRLLMIYITSQGGIDPQTRKNLLEAAGIPMSSPLVHAVSNLKNFGVDLMKERKKTKVVVPKERLAQFADRMKKITLKLMRYVSVIDEIATALVKDTLPRDSYPYIKDPPPKADVTSTKKGTDVTSRRNRAWRDVPDKKEETAAGPRVIIFVVGGVTFAELRSIYELSQSQNVNVFIGSTETLTPIDYIRALGDLPNEDEIAAQAKVPKTKKRDEDDDDDVELGIKLEKL